MTGINKLFGKKKVHVAFEISLILKGVFALAEIAAGLFTYLVTPQFLLNLMQFITRSILTEGANDFVLGHLLHTTQYISLSSQHFAAFYMLSHGIIKLWLIIGLWRGKHGYYPASIGVFFLFILYQMYRYSFTHSMLLLLITMVDLIVIWLIWMEYRNLHSIEHGKHA